MIFTRSIRKDLLVESWANNILSTKDQTRAVQRLAHRLRHVVPLQAISNRPTTTAYMWPTIAGLMAVEVVVEITIRPVVSPTTSSVNSKSKAWIRKRSFAVISPRNTVPWSLNRRTRTFKEVIMLKSSRESSSNQKLASNQASRKHLLQYNNSRSNEVSRAFQLHSKTVLINGYNNNNNSNSNCQQRF